MDFNNIATLIQYLLCIPAALISLSVHEYCHGYAAYRMGDPTARSLGRLTLNPLSHLDPIGTVCMVFFGFGWAKPVPINPRYFRDPRKGMALTAAAGPLSNLILAILGALLYLLTVLLAKAVFPLIASDIAYYFFEFLGIFFLVFHTLNLSLFVFNLIPLPPLDGSRILYAFLPPRLYFGMMKYERAIHMALLIALAFGAFTGLIESFVSLLSSLIFKLLTLIPFFA